MKLIYHPSDSALAARLQADFAQRSDLAHAVVIVLSPQALNDGAVNMGMLEALDQNLPIIPVLAQPAALPRLIEHLEAVDFTKGYDRQALEARLRESTNDFHMKVRTPAVKASNRRAAWVVGIIALFMFLLGVYGVGVLGIRPPQEEYDLVETEIILTRDYYIDSALPRSTEDALNFPATVDAARPTLRPLLIATATAAAG